VLSPLNGNSPQTITYKITPIAQTSQLGPTAPSKCLIASGGRYFKDPGLS